MTYDPRSSRTYCSKTLKIKGRPTHKGAVYVTFIEQGGSISRVDAASIENSDTLPISPRRLNEPTNEHMHHLRLLWRGSQPCTNSPNWLVGNNHMIKPIHVNAGHDRLQLSCDNLLSKPRLSLTLGFSDAEDWRQTSFKRSDNLSRYNRIRVPKQASPLRMTDYHAATAQIDQHLTTYFASVCTSMKRTDILGTYRDPRFCEQAHGLL